MSGIGDPVAYSLLGGVVPYPEHRLHWSLDSVPSIRFLCFPSVMVWSFTFSPSKIHRGSSLYKHISRLFFLFVLSASSPPVSVYSANPLQCLFPTSSVPHRPSAGKLPTLRLRSTNVFSWFPDPSSHMQVCTPRTVRLLVLRFGAVGGGKGEGAPRNGLESLVSSPGVAWVACLLQ